MKNAIILAAAFLLETACFAGDMGAKKSYSNEGLFLGITANLNSLNLTQYSWGQGISNIQTTGVNSNGVAQGNGAPFHYLSNKFSPAVQVGYFKHLIDSPNLYGLKFSYQYLGAIATNFNLYIPQLGETTSNTGVTSPLFGYVDANSVQITTNHEMTLIAFLGRSFTNKYIYFGAGPSLYNLQSKNYNSIGYAEFDGVTINVTGLISYSSPSIWALGGVAQIGMTYFIDPTWFVDVSYKYSMIGNNTTKHEQTFANASNVAGTNYNTSGTIFTKDTLRLNNQTLSIGINKVFNF